MKNNIILKLLKLLLEGRSDQNRKDSNGWIMNIENRISFFVNKLFQFKKRWIQFILIAGMFVSWNPIEAYIGLCCGKCGGNMCMNILGAGIPETHEFRFKITPMYMQMNGLKSGSSDVSGNDLLSLPNSLYQPSPTMTSMSMMSASPMVMQMPSDKSILEDHAYGEFTGRKYMAVPTKMNMKMLDMSIGYSFTDDFFAGLMFMAKKNSMDMKFNPMMSYITGRPGYTMESEGMTDTMLITKYRLYADDNLIPTSQISLVFGVSLPTGSINQKNKTHPLGESYKNPISYTNPGSTIGKIRVPVAGRTMIMEMPVPNRQNELLPYSMQFGSGTYDPVMGVAYQASASPFWWGVNVIYKARTYRNEQDYALGDEVKVDVYGMYQLTQSIVGYLQLNGFSQGNIQGEMNETRTGESGRLVKNNPYSGYMTPLFDPNNYGKDQINVSIGIQWQPMNLQIVDLTFSAPVYERVNGTQLSEEYRVQLAYYVEFVTSSSRRSSKYKKSNSKTGF